MDEEMTSGTSDFEESTINEPDDCYCEDVIDMGTLNFNPSVIMYKRWSTVGKGQYSEISAFWNIVEKYVHCSRLQGFGCDWTDTDFLYGIIFLDKEIPEECLNEVQNTFPDITVEDDYPIPDNYEYTYEGETKNLDPLYDEIWSKGPLAYELEEFDDDGNCRISVIYKQPIQESVVRSNTVYTTGNVTKIENFPFDKAYFGSPNKLPSTMKLDGPIFITPYIGCASIFAVRPQHLQKYGVPRGVSINRAYKEWDINLKDTLLQEPLKELHVILQGAPDIKESVENVSGYIYTVDITPDIRNHIYQSDKMNKDMEFCIDKLDTIDFSNIQEVTVKMTVSGAPARIQESAYYQEASNKTKVTREKNKIKNDLNVDKNGFGKIIDKETNKEIVVKLSFDFNKPTHVAGSKFDKSTHSFYVPMNINPNDLDRGHGFTKYLHEKNHIIQDLHKMKENVYENNIQKTNIKYTRDDDIADEKLAKAFINKHRNDLLGKHSKDPEEYLADLHTARKRGFNETIKTLEDMVYYDSKNKNKSIKNNLAILKRESEKISEKEYDNEKIKGLMKITNEMLKEHKTKLNYYETMQLEANKSDIECEKDAVKMLEKILASFDDFKKYVIKGTSLKQYEKLIEEYNNDLKMRILFLRDMKKIDDRNSHISEGFIEYRNKYDDPLDELLNIYNYKTYVESYNLMNSLYSDIDYQIKDIFQEYNITEDIIDDIMNYMILEYFENEEGV